MIHKKDNLCILRIYLGKFDKVFWRSILSTKGVGEKLRCVIKCAFSNFHEVLLKR